MKGLTLHIRHDWETVKRMSYGEYCREYVPFYQNAPDSVRDNPIPPGYHEGVLVGVALQECSCGARRTKNIFEPHPPRDTWTRGPQ